MKRVHVLTAGFSSSNGQAFLMPLVLHASAIAQAGVTVMLFHQPSPQLTDCDVLFLDGKYFGPRWTHGTDAALQEIASYREKVGSLIYVDLLDSAGWDHARALPYVTLYCKSQLLRDRSAYLKPFYGYRAYTDYYHTALGVYDDPPVLTEPAQDPIHLKKLTVSWNSGLANYSWLGPYLMRAYQHAPLHFLLRFPSDFRVPSASRNNNVSCRIGANYIRPTVSYQRKQMAALLKQRMPAGRVSRYRYIAELRDSKVVPSPFGYGEVCYRDFEVFMSGALLLKPDMSGLETWPDFYRDGETMVAHRWDLSDFVEKLDAILADYYHYLDIAVHAQETYRKYLCGPDAGPIFAEHLCAIITKAERLASEPGLSQERRATSRIEAI